MCMHLYVRRHVHAQGAVIYPAGRLSQWETAHGMASCPQGPGPQRPETQVSPRECKGAVLPPQSPSKGTGQQCP